LTALLYGFTELKQRWEKLLCPNLDCPKDLLNQSQLNQMKENLKKNLLFPKLNCHHQKFAGSGE